MNQEQERLLDHLLELEHRTPEAPIDLAESVADAWSSGERGSLTSRELAEIERQLGERAHEERDARPPTPAPRAVGPARELRVRAWIAAAAALVLALGVWAALAPKSSKEHFVADPSALVLRGASQVAQTTPSVRRGDAVVVIDGPVSLTGPGGIALHAQAPSLIAFPDAADGWTVDVVLGDVAVQTQATALEVRFGFATLSVLPDTALSFEATRVAGEEGEAGFTLPFARRALVDGFDEPRTLRVRVTVGRAELRSRGIFERVDPSSGTVSISSRSAPVVPQPTLERFDALTAYMLRGAPLVEPGASAASLLRELGDLLESFESLRQSFRARLLEARAAGTVTRSNTSYALDFLQADPSPQAIEVASAIWRDEPWNLTHGHIVAFAERGAFEFAREAEAMVSTWNDDPVETTPAPVLPAAFLALRGDDSGRRLLEASSAPPDEDARAGWSAFEFLVAAWGLELLGDEDAWPAAVAALDKACVASLVRDEVVEARRLVLALQIVADLREAPQPRLGLAMRRSFDEPTRRADELGTAEEVLALLRKLQR